MAGLGQPKQPQQLVSVVPQQNSCQAHMRYPTGQQEGEGNPQRLVLCQAQSVRCQPQRSDSPRLRPPRRLRVVQEASRPTAQAPSGQAAGSRRKGCHDCRESQGGISGCSTPNGRSCEGMRCGLDQASALASEKPPPYPTRQSESERHLGRSAADNSRPPVCPRRSTGMSSSGPSPGQSPESSRRPPATQPPRSRGHGFLIAVAGLRGVNSSTGQGTTARILPG